MGRKMAVFFFEPAPGEHLVQRVNKSSSALDPQLLTIAEVAAVCGVALPSNPERSSGETEILLESHYEHMEILRFDCTSEPGAPEPHIYSTSNEVDAEDAFFQQVPQEHRTKMALARFLQRKGCLDPDETLQGVWLGSLAGLRARAAQLLPTYNNNYSLLNSKSLTKTLTN